METQREDDVRARGDDGHPHAEERGLRRSQPCHNLALRVLASRTARK